MDSQHRRGGGIPDAPTQTLRAWEERYSLIVPVRGDESRYHHSDGHVEELPFLYERIELSPPPEDAHQVVNQRRRARVDGVARRSAATNPGDGRPSQEALLILLAGHDPYAAELIEYFERTEGYTAQIVLETHQVVERLRTAPPDLLVLDLTISGDTGLELCRTIRCASYLPIIAVSATEHCDAALEAGADAYLQKPLPPLQFVSVVRDLLGTSAYLRRSDLARSAIN